MNSNNSTIVNKNVKAQYSQLKSNSSLAGVEGELVINGKNETPISVIFELYDGDPIVTVANECTRTILMKSKIKVIQFHKGETLHISKAGTTKHSYNLYINSKNCLCTLHAPVNCL
jgi:hypothetical protein